MRLNTVSHAYQLRYLNYVNLLSYLETPFMSSVVTLSRFQVLTEEVS